MARAGPPFPEIIVLEAKPRESGLLSPFANHKSEYFDIEIRAAKAGSRVLIADETEEQVKAA